MPPPSRPSSGRQLFRLQMMEYLARANASRESLEMYRMIGALKRRKWGIIGFTLGLTLLAWYYVHLLPGQYRAQGQLVIDGSGGYVNGAGAIPGALIPGDFTNRTQAAILASRGMAKRVVTALPELREMAADMAVDYFLSGLSVRPNDRSFVLDVEYVSSNPAFAARAVNILMATYIADQQQQKSAVTSGGARWLGWRVEQMRGELLASERRLEEARRSVGRVLESGRDLMEEQLVQLTAEYGAARIALAETEARLVQFDRQRKNPDGVAATYGSNLTPMARAADSEAALASRFAEAKARYRENHPEYQSALKALQEAQKHRQMELSTVRVALNNDIDLARMRVLHLEADIAEIRGRIGAENNASIGLRTLQSEVAANRQLYEVLLARYREADVQSEALAPADARVISEAVTPRTSFAPRRVPMIAAAGLMALIAAVGLALIREFNAPGFLSPSQVEMEVHLPVLGGLPEFTSGSREMNHLSLLDPANQPLYAEAIRSLRVALFDRAEEKVPHVLLVTSSLRQEGKTLTALSLALTLKAAGVAVLVLDGNLRSGDIGKCLQFGATPGLGDYLAGRATPEQIIYQDKYSGLHIIPAGQAAGHPLDVLESEALDQLITSLRQQFRVILIDSPPVAEVQDAVLLSRVADGCLYLIRFEETARTVVAEGLRHIRDRLAARTGARTGHRTEDGAISIAISRVDGKKLRSYSPAKGDPMYFTNYAFTRAHTHADQ